MPYRPGQAFVRTFNVLSAAGVLSNLTGAAAVLQLNGSTWVGPVVTLANPSTGRYRVSVPIPPSGPPAGSYFSDDALEILVTGTIGGEPWEKIIPIELELDLLGSGRIIAGATTTILKTDIALQWVNQFKDTKVGLKLVDALVWDWRVVKATSDGGGGKMDIEVYQAFPFAPVVDDVVVVLADAGANVQAIEGQLVEQVPDASGPGADQVTLTITEQGTGLPIADADVWLSTDAAGQNVVAGTLQTDSNGQVTFLLDAGSTYRMWAQKDGENPVSGMAFTAVAD